MNQVKFLGPAHTFVTASSSNILYQTHSKKGTDTQADFTVVRGVLWNDYQPCNLIRPYQFWARNLTLFTRLFLAGRHMWASHETTSDPVEWRMIPGGSNNERLTNVDMRALSCLHAYSK